MDSDLRRFILQRDRECVAYKFDPKHVCRDTWGRAHWPTAIDQLTVEHVKSELAMGVKAPDDEHHLVAMCGWINGGGGGVASKELRQWLRHEYLPRITRVFPYKGLTT